jgi:hypothetical protein
VVGDDGEHRVGRQVLGDGGDQPVDDPELHQPGAAARAVRVTEEVEVAVVGVAERALLGGPRAQRVEHGGGEVAQGGDTVEAPAAQGGPGQPRAALDLRGDRRDRDPRTRRPLEHGRRRLHPLGRQLAAQVDRVGGAVRAPAQRVEHRVRWRPRVVERRHAHAVADDAVLARGQAGAQARHADRRRRREARAQRAAPGGQLGEGGCPVGVLGEQLRPEPVDEQQGDAAGLADAEAGAVGEPRHPERGGEGGRDVGQRPGGSHGPQYGPPRTRSMPWQTVTGPPPSGERSKDNPASQDLSSPEVRSERRSR